jgi:hypothetical protein
MVISDIFTKRAMTVRVTSNMSQHFPTARPRNEFCPFHIVISSNHSFQKEMVSSHYQSQLTSPSLATSSSLAEREAMWLHLDMTSSTSNGVYLFAVAIGCLVMLPHIIRALPLIHNPLQRITFPAKHVVRMRSYQPVSFKLQTYEVDRQLSTCCWTR